MNKEKQQFTHEFELEEVFNGIIIRSGFRTDIALSNNEAEAIGSIIWNQMNYLMKKCGSMKCKLLYTIESDDYSDEGEY